MRSIKEEASIIQFRKKKHLNVGIIIFGIIFIYLIATIVMYITAPHVSVYEVRQGSILKDNAYVGLAIRDEIVVRAGTDGYINYYAPNTSKVKVGSDIYTLSSNELEFETSKEELHLTDDEKYALTLRMQQFNHDFEEQAYSTCYQFKESLNSTLTELSDQSKLSQLNELLSQGNHAGVRLYSTEEDGIVVYSVDGMEEVTLDNLSKSMLTPSNYRKIEFEDNSQIKSGDPIYKIITDNNWAIAIELSQETYELLQGTGYVKVKFVRDEQILWAELELREIEGTPAAILYFDNAMIRYSNDRYLNIELILEDESGLKIPRTAVIEKDFYVIPRSYITEGGNSSDAGVMLQKRDIDGNLVTVFEPVTIYYEEDDIVYLDPNEFEEQYVLLKPESKETYQLSDKKKLQGVYCINKGYAVFKQIHILCESDTYFIVEEGNSYGLSNYDHIALNGSELKENDVVF